MLHRCCQQVTRAIPGADYVGVTLLREGQPYTAAASDELVHELDAAQYTGGTGPCLHAADTRQLVRVIVTDTIDR